jgi:hypothetical protein
MKKTLAVFALVTVTVAVVVANQYIVVLKDDVSDVETSHRLHGLKAV